MSALRLEVREVKPYIMAHLLGKADEGQLRIAGIPVVVRRELAHNLILLLWSHAAGDLGRAEQRTQTPEGR